MSAPCSRSERPKAKIAPSSSSPRRALAHGGVLALPDRAEPEDRDLPGVPVRQPVEGRDLVEGADPGGVPALVLVPAELRGRRQQRGEHPLALDELEEVLVPDPIAVVFLEHALAARLEPLDRRQQHAARLGVESGGVVGTGVEQKPVGLRWGSRRLLDTRHASSLLTGSGKQRGLYALDRAVPDIGAGQCPLDVTPYLSRVLKRCCAPRLTRCSVRASRPGHS